MFLTVSLAIVDRRSLSFDALQQGEVITGQTACCLLRVWAALLSAVALRTLYFTHFKLFISKRNRISPTNRIVRFVMRTEPKASYRKVQYEYAYRYTPNRYICCHVYFVL